MFSSAIVRNSNKQTNSEPAYLVISRIQVQNACVNCIFFSCFVFDYGFRHTKHLYQFVYLDLFYYYLYYMFNNITFGGTFFITQILI